MSYNFGFLAIFQDVRELEEKSVRIAGSSLVGWLGLTSFGLVGWPGECGSVTPWKQGDQIWKIQESCYCIFCSFLVWHAKKFSIKVWRFEVLRLFGRVQTLESFKLKKIFGSCALCNNEKAKTQGACHLTTKYVGIREKMWLFSRLWLKNWTIFWSGHPRLYPGAKIIRNFCA